MIICFIQSKSWIIEFVTVVIIIAIFTMFISIMLSFVMLLFIDLIYFSIDSIKNAMICLLNARVQVHMAGMY
ncbi:hypothetical protein DRF75_04040 [Ehrlichia minasensis]|uniref:Uncharacterized protein n=1 Tax=Ehrlichia minasensis TaxID=1242993 RepID=A0A4V2BQM1_9RICK|nr:hypothetical protein DRF75_04040 [Ehrlichia minasensis]